MGRKESPPPREARLLAWLEHEERLARWESLPPPARQKAVEQLARMLLRTRSRERADETGDTDPAAAP